MALLTLALVVGVGLRAAAIAGKRTITHDEAISYLCAAGTQGEYGRLSDTGAAPFNTWVLAREFKQFHTPRDPFCFRRIAADLAATDIHPPLYFWLLHLAALAAGVHAWTGPALNTLLAVATALALYGLARDVLRSPTAAAIVAWIWLVSPATIHTTFDARHYDLLALATVTFVWAVWRCGDARRRWSVPRFVALALATAFGALTHYHFALVAAGGGILLVSRLRGSHSGRLSAAATAMLLGVVLFAGLHPAFLRAGCAPQALRTWFDAGVNLPERLHATLNCYVTYFVNIRGQAWLVQRYANVLAAAAAAAILLGTLFWIRMLRGAVSSALPRRSQLAGRAALTVWPGDLRPGYRHRRFAFVAVAFLVLCVAGANLALYLAGLSPAHAMDPMNLAFVWPLLTLALASMILLVFPRRLSGLVAFALLMTLSGTVGTHTIRTRWAAHADPQRIVGGAAAIVLDNPARGVAPAIVWHLGDEQRVFIASQPDLAHSPQRWLRDLPPGAVFLGRDGHGASAPGRAALFANLAAQGYAVAPRAERLFWHADAWIITRDATVATGLHGD